ncbi:MAG: DUF1446 domain-containing protein [Mycolicibacterium cosmeticum]|nr:DUF1446 domain-containing protein [Mycolicibacterium cosmeticum]
MSTPASLRVANCSGFYGDRLSAAREMVEGGDIDVLTGDWLAELTMGVLAKQRNRSSHSGFARTFVNQIEDVLGICLRRGIKIVSNAGGLNPHACAEKISEAAQRAGLSVKVAVVDGDDATDAFARARSETNWEAPHLDSGEPFTAIGEEPLVVNAYLGAWGIKEALDAGADVVVTGRVTDAAIIVGPAAWHFGWARTNWDALAGAVVAGHIIECGAQASGGNFSFFHELDGMQHVGFPLAEIAVDGSSVITKHPDTGGAVTIETVTAQLLYEIDGPRYANPDVVVRLDTVQLQDMGADRVKVTGVRGEPAPDTVKVGAIVSGGWRNEMTFVLTGGAIEAKAELAQQALWEVMPGGRAAFERVSVRLVRGDQPDPATITDSVALLTVTVADPCRDTVNHFARAAIETGLSSYPGLYFTSPPGPATEMTIFWPTLMPAAIFPQRVTIVGEATIEVVPPPTGEPAPGIPDSQLQATAVVGGPVTRCPLGTILGGRSGDKAGNATLGIWARDDDAHRWLRSWWSEDAVYDLIPEAAGHQLKIWELPHLRACGVTIVGLLGQGVAANLDLDSQGKGLAEYVRAKHRVIPDALLHHGAQNGGWVR